MAATRFSLYLPSVPKPERKHWTDRTETGRKGASEGVTQGGRKEENDRLLPKMTKAASAQAREQQRLGHF